MAVTDLWNALELTSSDVVACVGAGGKTSVLLTLAACAVRRSLPVVLTTTTKMYVSQAADFTPVFSESYEEGEEQVTAALAERGSCAWFRGVGRDKLIGVPPEWIDRFATPRKGATVLVEADGAGEKMLKTPAAHEPVVPISTTLTVGVINLKALGMPLTHQFVHRPEHTCAFLDKVAGTIIGLRDLALVASKRDGIFQYSRKKRVLILTGAEGKKSACGHEFVSYLKQYESLVTRCILTGGFGPMMEVLEVWDL